MCLLGGAYYLTCCQMQAKTSFAEYENGSLGEPEIKRGMEHQQKTKLRTENH